MLISTRGRYALRVMLELAQYSDDGFLSLKTIADRQEISQRYLDQIMMLLNRADFLLTARGALGGYRLAREPGEYTVGDILRVTEGSVAPVPCLENDAFCERMDECMTRPVWEGLDAVITAYIDGLTLQDILDRYGDETPINFSI